MRAGNARMPRHVLLGRRDLDQGEGMVERRIGLPRILHHLDRAIPNGGDRVAVPDSDERGQSELGAVIPAFRDHLRANARRVT